MIRVATIADIPHIQRVRNSVKENMLSDPSKVTDEDCREYLTQKGRGWVYEVNNEIIGFAIVDLEEQNVWALFLNPEIEGRGIGKKLHHRMLSWYFKQKEWIWLGTEPNTRAEGFYRKMGWREAGMYGEDEIKFEMTREEWLKLNSE